MKYVKCTTQKELDDCLKEWNFPELFSGEFFISGSAQVRAYGSAQVTAYGSAQVTASGSAQVTASGSAQVTAYGSAQVTASGSAQVRAYGSAQVRASKYCAVTIHGKTVKCSGGVRINIPEISTAKEWCDYYGVEVKKGVATLYKAVDQDYSTVNARRVNIFYKPGEKPQAPDWDGGKDECGGGLHFSPSPTHALNFNPEGKLFIACPVKVASIAVHKNATYPAKIKAPAVCAAVFEVDIDGKPIRQRPSPKSSPDCRRSR